MWSEAPVGEEGLMATTSVRHLTAEQIAAYHRDGYLAVRNVIHPAQLEALRAATDEFLEQSRRVTSSEREQTATTSPEPSRSG